MANDHNAFLGGNERSDAPGGRPLQVGKSTQVFELLAHERRRKTIQVLEDECGTTLDREELAQRVATVEAPGDAPTDRLVRRVELSLHHKHLPMLDEHGVVDYDPQSGLTTYDPQPELQQRVQAIVE